MARPKTSVDRLSNLRETFKSNVGKVLTEKQVEKAVGASYWRACIKDLKNEGMQIESVRDGRAVVGYKFTSTTGKGKTVAAAVTKAPAKPAAKPAAAKPAAAKAAKTEAVAASKPKAKTKPAAKKAAKTVTEMVGETPAGEEDPDVLAILKQVGL